MFGKKSCQKLLCKSSNIDNECNATLEDALNATVGKGENTILEYSFGINDYTKAKGNKSKIKGWLKEGLETYMKAKPKSLVLLVTPVFTYKKESVQTLTEIYKELSVELNLPLLDVSSPTERLFWDENNPYNKQYCKGTNKT